MSVSNIRKIMQYLAPVACSDIEVDGTVLKNDVRSIKLSEKFFDLDECKMCGGCCVPEHNVFVQFEYDAIMSYTAQQMEEYGLPSEYLDELKENLTESSHTVNGAKIPLYTFTKPYPELYIAPRGRTIPRCYWAYQRDDGNIVCGIHPVRSITCRMPHMRILSKTGSRSASFTTTQFGRNYALKCPSTFHSPQSEVEFEVSKADKLDKLRYLERIADAVNVKTHLPEICAYIEQITFDNYRRYLGVNIINNTKKLFQLPDRR